MKSLRINAAFAGQSYPANGDVLLREFWKHLKRYANRDCRPSNMLLVPHIDFLVNLDLYALAYSHLLKLKRFPETFYILGVGHQCPHEFSAANCHYTTPLGGIVSDDATLTAIEQSCGFEISRSPATFRREHSIEFVVIWLQVLRELFFPEQQFKIVPIVLGGMYDTIVSGQLPDANHEITRFGAAVADSFKQHANAALVVSIDGCHVGPRFDHPFPANREVQAGVRQWETRLWQLCRSDRLPEFISHLHQIENAYYFDGVGALTLLLRNFAVTANREGHDLWYEDSDQSFVTFSGGYFQHQRQKRVTKM